MSDPHSSFHEWKANTLLELSCHEKVAVFNCLLYDYTDECHRDSIYGTLLKSVLDRMLVQNPELRKHISEYDAVLFPEVRPSSSVQSEQQK